MTIIIDVFMMKRNDFFFNHLSSIEIYLLYQKCELTSHEKHYEILKQIIVSMHNHNLRYTNKAKELFCFV